MNEPRLSPGRGILDQRHAILAVHVLVVHMIHELAYKIYAESPDGAVFERAGDVGIVALEWRERPSIVEQLDRQRAAIEPQRDLYAMAGRVDDAIGNGVGDEFVEREIEMADGGLRHIVADAERLHLPGKASDFGEFAFQLDDEFVLHRRVAPPAPTLIKLPGPPQSRRRPQTRAPGI